MASTRATLSRQARAMAEATWATSRAWVRRVRWWSAGKMKTWVLPAKRPERGRVKDPIPVALEARPPGIGVLRPNPPARARRPCGACDEVAVLGRFATFPAPCAGRGDADPVIAGMSLAHTRRQYLPSHSGRPLSSPDRGSVPALPTLAGLSRSSECRAGHSRHAIPGV